jgi:hypothetical protein
MDRSGLRTLRGSVFIPVPYRPQCIQASTVRQRTGLLQNRSAANSKGLFGWSKVVSAFERLAGKSETE